MSDYLRKIKTAEDAFNKIINAEPPESSLMEDLGKVRSETVHTKFLASFFNKVDDEGIKNLLKIIRKWDLLQNKVVNSTLRDDLQNLTISNISSKSEFRIKTESYGNGSIDILIQATVESKAIGSKKLNIIIENKIDASETVKVSKSAKEISLDNCETNDGILYQTDAYYDFFTGEKSNYRNDINVFVYLKPTTTLELYDVKPGDIENGSCHCDKYVQINYQELYNYVIQPYLEKNKHDYKVMDYVRALGKPANKNNNKLTPQIMAINKEEQDKLMKLFKDKDVNQIIIDAINVMASENETDEDLCKAYKAIARSIKEINKRTIYIVTDSAGNQIAKGLMAEIAQEFAIKLLKEGKSVEDVDEIIRTMRSLNGKSKERCFSDRAKVFNEYSPGKPRANPFTYNGMTYYVTDQWSATGIRPTFNNFINNVNKKFKDFQIKKKV